MDVYKQIETDDELKMVMPLIEEFAQRTGAGFSQCLNEVTVSMSNLSHLSMIWLDGDLIKGYICGYFISPTEFWLTQGLKKVDGKSPEDVEVVEAYFKEVIKRGGRVILGQTLLNPAIFERWGLKFSRFLVRRDFTEDEIKEATNGK